MEIKLSEIAIKSTSVHSIGKLPDNAVNILYHLDELYGMGEISKKREIVGALFPAKSVLMKRSVEPEE